MSATNHGLKCDFCGSVKKEVSFFIGAKREADTGWCMVEGTGKMACDKCYPLASKEAQIILNKLVTV